MPVRSHRSTPEELAEVGRWSARRARWAVVLLLESTRAQRAELAALRGQVTELCRQVTELHRQLTALQARPPGPPRVPAPRAAGERTAPSPR